MLLPPSDRLRQLARVAFWLVLVFALVMAFLPKPPQLPIDGFGDKFEHMLAFVTMSVLAIMGYPATSRLKIIVRLSLLGALIEVVQAIPVLHRDSDVFDWVADTVAVLVIVIPAQWFEWRSRAVAAER